MFDMGFIEILLIGIVALVVIGPERLPAVAKKAGYYFGRIQRFVTNVRSDVEREFRTDELQRMLTEQQSELHSLKQRVNESVSEATSEIDPDSIEQAIKSPAPKKSKKDKASNPVDAESALNKQEIDSP